jgi:hypothetical protein
LSVPAPAGVLANTTLRNQSGAEGAFRGAKTQLFGAIGSVSPYGLLTPTGWLTDEFTIEFSNGATGAKIDARITSGGRVFLEDGHYAWSGLLQARAALLGSIAGLAAYEPAGSRSSVGEAYALAGYAELLLAESFCAGTPLDGVHADGTIEYGMPLTADSLVGVAEAHFDSALAGANGDATVAALASVGLGRALVDRGQYAAAATAVATVPASFDYNGELSPNNSTGAAQRPNLYAYGVERSFARVFNVADREGGNGLNFVSAHDARLVLDTSLTAADGGPWYLPVKFETNLSLIPLATGLEAQLIAAEAALNASQASVWLADLNALRNSGCTVNGVDTTCALGTGQVAGQTAGLPSLSDPGTDSGRVSLMFRERAFWLFGTGTRLGDLRRLIRQYGRDQSTVFPTGPYANGQNPNLPAPIPTYGTDVTLTLPTTAALTLYGGNITNPNYKGCIASTKTA